MFAEVLKLIKEITADEISRDTRQRYKNTISIGFIERIRYQN